ncbi:hypothetical protein [Methylobacterium sp. Leaf100]|jgi:hypothetical protein|nr:hypothetical protein [Methylobacterium sp. Leaf100]
MTELTATEVPGHGLWHSIPLELLMSVGAVILAGGLKLTGLLP